MLTGIRMQLRLGMGVISKVSDWFLDMDPKKLVKVLAACTIIFIICFGFIGYDLSSCIDNMDSAVERGCAYIATAIMFHAFSTFWR